MKRFILCNALVTACLSFAVTTSVEAHSGRTDSSGGHNCSEKSVAKGLCTGYHYHNGGGSSSNGSSSGGSSGRMRSSAPSPAKPAGPTPEQIAAKEKAQGEADGYATGYAVGYQAATKNTVATTGSDAYRSGYAVGYERGYTEGYEKISAEKEVAHTTGYATGKNQDNLDIPSLYKGNIILEAAFSEGFNKGVSERDTEKKKEYMELGFNDGKNDQEGNQPSDIKPIYITAYQEGYEKGQKELKEIYVKQGYNAAFTMLLYKEPTLSKSKYVDWYKEGFDSAAKEVKAIQKAGYDLGVNGKTYNISEKYIKGEVIFKEYYQRGKADYRKNMQESTETMGSLGLIGVGGWLTRRFYVARKMIK
jgi:hypothetical protein